jgi:hypothetical protein
MGNEGEHMGNVGEAWGDPAEPAVARRNVSTWRIARVASWPSMLGIVMSIRMTLKSAQ